MEGCYGSRVVLFIEESDMVIDVTTTFLRGDLEEVIYMAQPKGYEEFHRNSYDACAYWKLSQKGIVINQHCWKVSQMQIMMQILIKEGPYQVTFFTCMELIPIIHCDSQSAIHLAKNPSNHERSKHIDVKFH
ncbi:Retrovirus-related Pol polyprotein from transposon TNT 1-94 [Cucumis melo var. makuwa]|uniref:Retrovirus-related Pol polyprotein from transposon TNT 1-94 n=1 Tax=Cucumis melo var. makuwa TaxID=1194695 RepID=A0A5A7SUG9_CUCMM|nr:Retrovirus-related Pol polyprotein from transposon TNT 1-94 [Cucumis melo var. makuwa]